MIKAIIVDDESNNSKLIGNLLKLYCPEVEVLGIANSVNSGFKMIKELEPNLVFLDVKMPDGTGFDLLKCFDQVDFKVVFITAHNEFAIDAFKVCAIDYILKPASPAQMIASVKKAQESITRDELNTKMQSLLEHVGGGSEAPNRKKISLKTLDKVYSVSTDDIVRFESEGNYTKVFLNDGQKIMVSRLLKEFDEMLSNQHFIRVHQSHLVNTAYIHYFHKLENQLVMKDNSVVPVAVRKKDLVLSYIG